MSCRSREGAWIEIGIISSQPKRNRSRSREGAWIEIVLSQPSSSQMTVAPVRERGLKLLQLTYAVAVLASLPRGSVD